MSKASDWNERTRWEEAGLGELYNSSHISKEHDRKLNDRKRIDDFCDQLANDPEVQAMVNPAPEEVGNLYDYFSNPETIQLPTPPEELER